MQCGRERRADAGFSLPELLMVLLILLVITAMALPSLMTTIANNNLRTAATTYAGTLQLARMQAIAQARWYTVRTVQPTGSPSVIAYVDLDNDGALDPAEPQAEFASGTQLAVSGYPPTASMMLSYSPHPPTTLPSFSPRGVPCAASGTSCSTPHYGSPVGFLYLLRDSRAFGQNGWAAVSVSPGGRIRVWMWNGLAWN